MYKIIHTLFGKVNYKFYFCTQDIYTMQIK